MIDNTLTSWYALVNPRAASGRTGENWAEAKECLLDNGVKFEIHFAGEDGRGTDMVRRAAAAGRRHFIAIGGDGTVHEVLDGIARLCEDGNVSLSEFYLAVIPLGSGNDWIKTTKVPKNARKAARLLVDGVVGRQDVVKISNLDAAALPEKKVESVAYMSNVGGMGMDSQVCVRVNMLKEQGKKGKWLYVKSLIYWILHRRHSECEVRCDGKTIFRGAYYAIAFGNGKYSGGGLRQTPDAIMDDGLLDVTIVPEVAMSRIAIYAPRLFGGSFNKIPIVTVARGKKYYISPVEHADEVVEADGDIVGRPPVELEVLPAQLNIIKAAEK